MWSEELSSFSAKNTNSGLYTSPKNTTGCNVSCRVLRKNSKNPRPTCTQRLPAGRLLSSVLVHLLRSLTAIFEFGQGIHHELFYGDAEVEGDNGYAHHRESEPTDDQIQDLELRRRRIARFILEDTEE